ncbi:MAG TPA: HAD family phosphatase [Pirellulaceae bacterium]|nr:HAD family phosphatase [Pirellulaceae bacterium]
MEVRSPQFLYFDLGNVLLTFDHHRGARQMAEVAGIEPQRAYDLVFGTDLEHRYERGELDCQGFYDEFCRLSNARPEFALLKQAAAEIFEPNLPVIDLARQLHAAGHRLGVLSNTCAAHWDYCIDGRYPFLNDCFSTYALSYELKSMKPDAAIYHRAATLAGVPLETIFFVDDRPDNVQGACALGMQGVLFTSVSQLRDDLISLGCLPASSVNKA